MATAQRLSTQQLEEQQYSGYYSAPLLRSHPTHSPTAILPETMHYTSFPARFATLASMNYNANIGGSLYSIRGGYEGQDVTRPPMVRASECAMLHTSSKFYCGQ